MDKKAQNREIVRRTHSLMTSRFRSIMPAAVLSVLLSGASVLTLLLEEPIRMLFAGVPQIAALAGNVLSGVINIVVYALIYPAVILGLARVLLQVWRGEGTSLREYFRLYTDKGRFALGVKAGLAATLLTRAVSLVTYGASDLIVPAVQHYAEFADGTVAAVARGLVYGISFAAGVCYLVLSLVVFRFTLAAVVEWADERACDVLPTMGRSWRLSRGMLLRSVGLVIRTSWIPYLMICVLAVIVGSGVGIVVPYGETDIVFGVIIVLLLLAMIFLLPLMRLPVIGLVNEQLLKEMQEEEGTDANEN